MLRAWWGEGYKWCASINLKSFFDEIPHNLILKLIRRKMAGERLVTLIARALKARVVVEEKFEETTKGCPQGSPLSPMLSNIVLNELDQVMERRGHRYARWADDFLILLKSERAAHRVMEGVVGYLEEQLNLPVNKEKSEVASSKEVPFLGFQILRGKVRVSDKARTKLKGKVRELTRRKNPPSMHQIIEDLNEYLRGCPALIFERLWKELVPRLKSSAPKNGNLKSWN
jgi:group II intron reverse transcriptase/maturase